MGAFVKIRAPTCFLKIQYVPDVPSASQSVPETYCPCPKLTLTTAIETVVKVEK